MSEGRIFGTDGVRGRAGEGWLSAENVARIGRAIGEVLAESGGATHALLGHDGRRSGPELEGAAAAGLATAGVPSQSAGLITTPGLAWLTRTSDACLGIMISASHNPAEDNGIKVFSSSGGKLSDELEDEIETTPARGPRGRSARVEGTPTARARARSGVPRPLAGGRSQRPVAVGDDDCARLREWRRQPHRSARLRSPGRPSALDRRRARRRQHQPRLRFDTPRELAARGARARRRRRDRPRRRRGSLLARR